MGEGRIAVGPYLMDEGALAAVELFGSFPGQPMGRLLILSLQAVAVDLLTITTSRINSIVDWAISAQKTI